MTRVLRQIGLALAAYLAVFTLLHATTLGAPFVYGRMDLGEIPGAALSLPILSIVMTGQATAITLSTVAGLLLAVAAGLLWRRSFAWLLLTAALLVLQAGGIFGMGVMSSV